MSPLFPKSGLFVVVVGLTASGRPRLGGPSIQHHRGRQMADSTSMAILARPSLNNGIHSPARDFTSPEPPIGT